jgi:hypothetical protein
MDANLDIIVKLFDQRMSGFESALLDLRTDIREANNTQAVLFSSLIEKMEVRIEQLDKDRNDHAIEIDRANMFITSVKWVSGIIFIVVLSFAIGLIHFPGYGSENATSAFNNSQLAPEHVTVPIHPAQAAPDIHPESNP